MSNMYLYPFKCPLSNYFSNKNIHIHIYIYIYIYIHYHLQYPSLPLSTLLSRQVSFSPPQILAAPSSSVLPSTSVIIPPPAATHTVYIQSKSVVHKPTSQQSFSQSVSSYISSSLSFTPSSKLPLIPPTHLSSHSSSIEFHSSTARAHKVPR